MGDNRFGGQLALAAGSIPSRDRAAAADSPVERAGEAPWSRILGSIRLSVTAAELS